MTRLLLLSAAILLSGGDAQGMNALLRMFVLLAQRRYGTRALGIKDGYAELMRTAQRWTLEKAATRRIRGEVRRRGGRDGICSRRQDIVLMDDLRVSGIIDWGGINLGAERREEFEEQEEVRSRSAGSRDDDVVARQTLHVRTCI